MTQSLRILHVVQSLDPTWGGMARVVPELAARLTAAGDASAIATLAGGRFGTPPRIAGAEVLTFDCPGRARLGRSEPFDARIEELLSRHDVLHLHGLWTGQNWSAGKAARKLGRPYVMTPHSMMMPWAWQRSWWKKRPAGWLFEHRNLRGAALLHALSEGEAEAIRGLGFNPRVEVIPNGIDAATHAKPAAPDALLRRFPELAGKNWLLILGRVHPQKGIVPAMQAAFDVLAASQGWRLIVAGRDEVGMVPMLRAAVGRKKLADRVTFTGHLSREESAAALGGAKLLLQPSLSEGLSMSVLEALATGVPVVISPACNLPEVEACDAGRIVEPTRREIAAALRQLLSLDESVRVAMGRRGQLLVGERFDWCAVLERYRAMYRSLVATPRPLPAVGPGP